MAAPAAAEAIALLETLKGQVQAVTDQALGLLRSVRRGAFPTEKGLSPLGLRGQQLLLYLQDLGLVAAAKAGGRSLGGLPALDRLMETRVVLEKLRPLERRLRYQVEKLLRAAVTGGRDADDPLSFRPAPANMAAQEEEEEEEPSGGGAKAPGLGGGRRYVPPRLVPVQYDEEGVSRERRRREGSRRRALGSSVIRELREELGEGPREEDAGGGADGRGPLPPGHARLEESLLTRLRAGEGRRKRGGALASITHFRDIGALLEQAANREAPPIKRRKKKVPKKKKGRGYRPRRR